MYVIYVYNMFERKKKRIERRAQTCCVIIPRRRRRRRLEDGIVRARQQTRESPKDNERPLRTGINRKKINTKNKFQTIYSALQTQQHFIVRYYAEQERTHTPHTRAFAARRRVKRRYEQQPLITRGGSDTPRYRHVVILVCAGPTSTPLRRLHRLHSPV